MTEVPKIVYDRLRAAQKNRVVPDGALLDNEHPDSGHPDADLLTAFAERTLSAAERDATLEHLALCNDCRDVMALALPITEIADAPIAAETGAGRAPPVPAKTGRNWLTLINWPKVNWPALASPKLGWAALAAGVVVVASVLLMHPGKVNQALVPSANRQVTTPVPPVSDAQIASAAVPSSSITTSPMEQPAISAKTGELRANGQLVRKSSSRAVEAGRGLTSSDQTSSVETGEVATAAASPLITPEPAAEETLVAQNEAPPVVRTKPPLQDTAERGATAQSTQADEQQKSKMALVPKLGEGSAMYVAKQAPGTSQALAQHDNVVWTITEGVLQRSLDSGQSWQDALRPQHPLLCYAPYGKDVWAGGQAGTLFHSVDGGLTWTQVQPSQKGQQLTSDVIRIELQGSNLQRDNQPGNTARPTQIVLSTSNNDIWSSIDGGTTWNKK
ncbi:MAG: zf-HC2 domain-containing protein [Terriglobales bacterium]